MKKAKTIILSSLLLSALGVGVYALAANSRQNAEVHALGQDGDYVVIEDKADFLTVFDGGAAYYNRKIKLGADIDLEGASYTSARMAGEFQGELDGNGHKVYNYSLGGVNVGFFNIIGSTGYVHDIEFDWIASSKECAGFSFLNNGTIEDCTSEMTISSSDVYSVWAPGGFSKAQGSGTYSGLTTVFIMNAENNSSDSGTYPATIVTEGTPTFDAGNKFSVAGTYSDSTKVRAQGSTEIAKVTSISLSDDSATLDPAQTLDVTLSMVGTDYDSVVWSSDDTNVATVSGNASGATITAVAGGTATITVTVTIGTTELTDTVAVTVNSAISYVTDVTLDQDSGTAVEGGSVTLTATLTGVTYTSLTWESDDTYIATVNANGLTATVDALLPGSANIKVTVVSEAGTFSDTFALVVTEAPKMKVAFVVKDGFVNLGPDGFGLWIYGAPQGQMVPLTSSIFKMKIGDDLTTVYLATINLYKLGSVVYEGHTDNLFVQLCSATHTDARWGVGYQLGTAANYADGAVLTMNDWSVGNTAVNRLGSATNLIDAVQFYMDLRTDHDDKENSICYLLNDVAALNKVINDYDGLSEGAQTLVDMFYEVSNDGTKDIESTFAETIAYLKTVNANYGSGSRVALTENSNGSIFVIIALASVATLCLASVITIIIVKKRHFAK